MLHTLITMTRRYLSRPRNIAVMALVLLAGTSAKQTTDDQYTKAAALGVFRSEDSGLVSIDFDVPRYGPLCIAVDEGIMLNITWEEYHNLYQILDENSFEDCDFSDAIPIAPEGKPRPDGITFFQLTELEGNGIPNAPNYFSCSKICASRGHKVKVCRGGVFGEPNECDRTPECRPERTVDVRSTAREYLPVGKVCRPKNRDGYFISSGIDTPESCRQRCDDQASKCGAWEFEDHDLDNKECELHEISVVSYEETLAMGDCEITNNTGGEGTNITDNEDYRCCWIAKEVVKTQIENNLVAMEVNESSDYRATAGGHTSLFYTAMAMIVALLAICI